MNSQIKFVPGSIATARQRVEFSDNTEHHLGQKVTVTEKDVAYFNVNQNLYDKDNDTAEQAIKDRSLTKYDYQRCIFRDYFTSPFDQHKDKVGQRFTVLGHDEEAEQELENYEEMFKIRFEGGEEITAWGHEVCELIRENCS